MTGFSMGFLQRSAWLSAGLLLLLPLYGNSQGTGSLEGCRAADVDTTFQLTAGPGDEFTVAFDMRNITRHACILDRASYGANGSPTNPDRTEPWGKVFVSTPDSNERVWGTARVTEQVSAVLDPDKAAYFTIRWKTKPPRQNDPCVQVVAVNWPVHIVAPSLLKPLCSEIEVSPFSFRRLLAVTDPKAETEQDSGPQVLVLATKWSPNHESQGVRLHVSLRTDDTGSSVSKDTRPTVYLRRRSPDDTTEFRATSPLPHKGCQKATDTHVGVTAGVIEEIDWKKGFDLDPDFCGSVIDPKRQGNYSFQVFKAVASSHEPVRFVDSNVVRTEFQDTARASQLGTVR